MGDIMQAVLENDRKDSTQDCIYRANVLFMAILQEMGI